MNAIQYAPGYTAPAKEFNAADDYGSLGTSRQTSNPNGGTNNESDDESRGRRGVRRGRPTRNPCWAYFTRLTNRNVQCNLCGKVVKSACATNMTKHLERHHHTVDIMDNSMEGSSDLLKLESKEHWQYNGSRGAMESDGYEQVGPVWTASSSWPPGTTRPPKRNRRTKHPVWELFRRTSDGQAQCQLCSCFVRSPCSSNFMGHLNRHHSEHYQSVYSRWMSGRRLSDPAHPLQSTPPYPSVITTTPAPSTQPPPNLYLQAVVSQPPATTPTTYHSLNQLYVNAGTECAMERHHDLVYGMVPMTTPAIVTNVPTMMDMTGLYPMCSTSYPQ